MGPAAAWSRRPGSGSTAWSSGSQEEQTAGAQSLPWWSPHCEQHATSSHTSHKSIWLANTAVSSSHFLSFHCFSCALTEELIFLLRFIFWSFLRELTYFSCACMHQTLPGAPRILDPTAQKVSRSTVNHFTCKFNKLSQQKTGTKNHFLNSPKPTLKFTDWEDWKAEGLGYSLHFQALQICTHSL